MSWNNLANNQMVSFTDASSSPFTLLSGQSHVVSNQCMTKSEALAKYNLNATSMSAYATNQLVPKSVWVGVSVIPIAIISVNTTNPTNQAGNNGAATIVFSGGVGPYTYTLNNVLIGAATSPLTITNLLSSTTYTVQIRDSNNVTATTTFTLGQSIISFTADFIMITYEFTDGRDLDTKTLLSRITTPTGTISPVPGQTTTNNYLGYSDQVGGVVMQFPLTGTPILSFGGDNQNQGFESVLINVRRFKEVYPTATSFVIDCRCLWWVLGDVGVNPVQIDATLWKNNPNDAPVENGCNGYCWTNPTAIQPVGSVTSTPKQITATRASPPPNDISRGERLATLTYNLTTNSAVLRNVDTQTPTI